MMEQKGKADGYFVFRFLREGFTMSRIVYLWCLSVVLLFSSGVWGEFDNKWLNIGLESRFGSIPDQEPYLCAYFDAGGFSDTIYYGPSSLHNGRSYHELLSGELGAAIYYDGINTEPVDPADPNSLDKAMWITKKFIFPDWTTNSDFVYGGVCDEEQSSSNPAPGNDTGYSVIYNDEVEIRIDYELVDMSQLGDTYSPMSYIDPKTGLSVYLTSDSYCILQTYTIKNTTAQSLTNLEFYQFLHAHGADEYGPCVNSTYCAKEYTDPLSFYVPYNSVHCAPGQNTVGNFRYDLTQWNTYPHPMSDPTMLVDHSDFVTISCAVEPTWIENGHFRGGHVVGVEFKPSSGTHINIENRSLNDANEIYIDEVGGAMGWALGTLAPNATAKVTIGFFYVEAREEPVSIILEKWDDLQPGQCVSPGDEFEYTIQWTNTSDQTLTDVTLTDVLPDGVTYPEGSWRIDFSDPNLTLLPPDPLYHVNMASVTYTWNLPDIGPYETGQKTLRVQVNDRAEPGMILHNEAILRTGDMQVAYAEWDTPVCCDGLGIIYVDDSAQGGNSGKNWINAYTSLQDALERARQSSCIQTYEIRIAQGTYTPGIQPEDTFAIPAGVSILGGYRGGTVSPDDRNPKRYPTILNGTTVIDPIRPPVRVNSVVTMGADTLLSGVTVKGAAFDGQGVYGSGVDFTLAQCTIEDNLRHGVVAVNGNVDIQWCYIRNNRLDGIQHNGLGHILNVDNSWIMRNLARGLATQDSTPHIRNSILTESDLSEYGNPGIRILNPTSRPVLRNCTFAHNRSEGVFFEDDRTISDPNDKDYPDVQNCILWYNNSGNEQFSGFGKEHIYYSAVFDPNDPNGMDMTLDANFNFTANPKLIYIDPNNVRISHESPAKDSGNPYLDYNNQADMDGRQRVLGLAVDRGAYEVLPDCQSDFHELDWNRDGQVNYYEFSAISTAWLSRDPNEFGDPNLSDPNETCNWNPLCNLDKTGDSAYVIDLADLEAFVFDVPWCWKACWRDLEDPQMMMAGGGDEMLMMSIDFMEFGSLQTLSEPTQPELSVEDQIAQLEDSIVFLARIWLEEPDIQQQISSEDWQEFMGTVYQSWLDLQTQSVQIE